MPKAKPVSLYPLSFDEAIKAIIGTEPKTEKKKPTRKPKTLKSHS